ncbi:MAG: cation transporter [Pseudomonadales bacterium]|nr:MAG: cation transporter [Pseudomonadales bacterium]
MSSCGCGSDQAEKLERKTLLALLAINAAMFIVEIILGLLAESTGLIADSIDMLADAGVYGISLYVVGKGIAQQSKAASLSGILQIILGFGVIAEVLRRLYFGSEPESFLIMTVGAVALIANIYCVLLISKHRDSGVHMRASWIFTTNDVIANLGVIISGGLVWVFGSRYPDLVVGAIISAIVVRGGFIILNEAKQTQKPQPGA